MMPAFLAPPFNTLFNSVLNHLWQSTLFAAVAGLLTLAFRKHRAQTRYWLWLAASLKFLIPFGLLVALGSHLGWRTGPVSQPNLYFAMEGISNPFTPQPQLLFVPPTKPAASPISAILLIIWVTGLVTIGFNWWLRLRRVRAVLRRASPLQVPGSLPRDVAVMSSSTLLEPGVFGIRRPLLLLPEGISEKLAPAQLNAIVAHELCHVRRRDNLAAALQMGVEALFWFHPLVWWLGARLIEERERACDEEVLLMGNEPQVYAEGILKVCEFYLESPLVCVSGVTGSNLKRRIEEIMKNRVSRELGFGRKVLLAFAGTVVVAGPLAIGVLNAPQLRGQSVTGPLAFDLASIKPSVPGSREGGVVRTLAGGQTFIATNVTLKNLIMAAYSLKVDQVSGGPAWVTSDHYDIEAKTIRPTGRDEQMRMLQTLLADRFRLILRNEKKVQPVYVLVYEKAGPNLKQNMDGSETLFYFAGVGHYTARNVPMSYLAWSLSRFLEVGRVVFDKTGLTAGYDFELLFTPAVNVPNPQDGGATDPGPSLFTALKQQLGVKLESSKEPVDFINVDHADQPSEN
jgi:uncharacterized protein (TIGR03435 family)